MTLAHRIVNAIAALYAYAMAPDDYTPETRRETIAEGDVGLAAAEAVPWLEDRMANPAILDVVLEYDPLAPEHRRYCVHITPIDGYGHGPGIVEAIADARARSEAVDDRNNPTQESDERNHP